MKKLLSLIVLTSLLLVSCSDGDPGPPGPQGPAGQDGLDGLGYTYERTIDFNYESDLNLYSQIIDIPDEVATFEPESDAVLVYRLELVDADGGGTIDTWSMLPQNFFLNEGIIQYVFNHTATDVEILIDGNFDLSGLDSGFTDDQTFRIVILPSANFEGNADVDFSDLNAVQERFNLSFE